MTETARSNLDAENYVTLCGIGRILTDDGVQTVDLTQVWRDLYDRLIKAKPNERNIRDDLVRDLLSIDGVVVVTLITEPKAKESQIRLLKKSGATWGPIIPAVGCSMELFMHMAMVHENMGCFAKK